MKSNNQKDKPRMRYCELTDHVSLLLALVPSLERELGDAGLIEFAQAFFDHAVILLLGGRGEWQIEPFLFGQIECDAGVLGGMSRRKEAGMLAVLHVFAIGLEDA